MSGLSAAQRVQRLLALIPWLREHRPGGATIAEVSDRFDYPTADLVSDLTDVVNFISADRYQLSLSFDVLVTEDWIRIDRNALLNRPMKMGSADLAALMAAGRAAAMLVGDDRLGPLERAVAKLVGTETTEAPTVELRLTSGGEKVLTLLREAIRSGRCVELDYYSYNRDEESRRVVEPHRCVYDRFWYLTAYCRLVGAGRVFRLDRVRDATLTDLPFTPAEEASEAMDGIPVDGSVPEVVLELDPEAHWVVEQYPHSALDRLDDGRVRVTLPVTADRWLERLLLRLGPSGRIVSAPEGLGEDLRAAAATRVLSRYR
jgi:proteasome accessory factor C